ncbi:adenylate/guanylate cyclase domain-containing protein [Ilumatobacter sp.]|uniref:adenylate/guanylate cyclase domain-containing protein n=1 Tax=Ilumatobacter sp. TaxID=1967498 RepID=UPI003752DD8B
MNGSDRSVALLVHDAILRGAIERGAIESNDGYVFTTAGDSFAAAFGRASDAVRAATESQHALMNASWLGPELKVGTGLHLGEAEERGGDYFGPTVNTAARVEAAGHGGQVLMTDTVRVAADVTDVTDLGIRALGNVAEPLRLFQVGTDTFAALRVVDLSMSNIPLCGSSISPRSTTGLMFPPRSQTASDSTSVLALRPHRFWRFLQTRMRWWSSTTANTSSTKARPSSKPSSPRTARRRFWRRVVRRSTSTVNGSSCSARSHPTALIRQVYGSLWTGPRSVDHRR